MIKATSEDRHLAINILSKAFQDNKSVKYIIPDDDKYEQRVTALMMIKKLVHLFLYPEKKSFKRILIK